MTRLPLDGLLVLEFTHAVMGPTTGLLLADMGAEVIHIEPIEGDHTRRLKGFGTGYFHFYNRNKKSLAVDLKTEEGREIIYGLAAKADIVVENFGPGTMERLGLGYEKLSQINSRIIYCALKGFMPGPYEKRHAMDEVVQMMGGLAYMTGRTGDPLRAGSSVIDITGGMFGFSGILMALYERERSQTGKFVQAALFETTAFLMGQHLAYSAISQAPLPPMPERVSAWSIYRIFLSADDRQIFVGVISEKHWERFCRAFNKTNWLNDERLATNSARIEQREWFIPEVEALFGQYLQKELIDRCEMAEIPFAPIARPEDLFEDPQLNAGDSLLVSHLPDGTATKLPKTPIRYGSSYPGLRNDPPQIGQHSREILENLGYDSEKIDGLQLKGIINTTQTKTV
jgi:crotonobetainyl-CoA:carnitine CoA-transferase CaiB-like acyl-CoA transferase